MTKLTIEHNWNIYSWIGDKWGVWEITKIRIEKWDISPDTPMVQVEMNTMWKNTNHSIDQLVKLWYMELQPQEECNHVSDWMVYTSNPPKYKCKKCGYMTTEYMAQEEKTEETIEELEKKQESNTTFVTEWTPTPWEMIEGTNDPWRKMKFKRINTGDFWEYPYICGYDDETWTESEDRYLKHIRPLAPEELKLEKLPELNLKWDTEYQRDSAMIDQFNLLTTTVNLLIDKLNNK